MASNVATDLKQLHGCALRAAGELVAQVRPADLSVRTPCAGWDLAALLAHMTGQDHGFADALTHGDAPASAFAPRDVGLSPAAVWKLGAERLSTAVGQAPADRAVRLAEVRGGRTFPAAVVIGFHLLDTVVHGWDVATALGLTFRPSDALVAATLRVARHVPDGEAREQPGAAFAPALAAAGDDDWATALALLGRRAA